MQSSEVITKLVQHGDCTKETYITVYTRNSYGDVLSKTRYPVVAVFSHSTDAEIYVEESQGTTTRGLEILL